MSKTEQELKEYGKKARNLAARYAFDEYQKEDFAAYVMARVWEDDAPEVNIYFLFTHWLRKWKGAVNSAQHKFITRLLSLEKMIGDSDKTLKDSLIGKEPLPRIDRRLLIGLKERERISIILMYEYGFTYTEISDTTGVSRAMIQWNLRDAHKKIKKLSSDTALSRERQ